MGLASENPIGELCRFPMTTHHTTTTTFDDVGGICVKHRGASLGVTPDGPGGLLPLLTVGVTYVRTRNSVGQLVEQCVADVLRFDKGTVYENP